MSDSIEKLCKEYDENVSEPRTRNVGLFTIPEYPEYEARGMWSAALDAILTTLRYLAPATLLTLLWGQQSFIFKILKYIDSAFRSLLFSNEEQKQAVLQWVSEHGPVRVEELGTVWQHGWVLCGVLDSALPGACAGHPPTQLSLKHAQAIAAQYLGVEPVFSRQELESNDNLSKHQEWRLTTYLDSVRQAVTKVTPSVAKTNYQKPSKDTTQFILDYIARGSGLSAAQINHPMYFKIYPTSQQTLDPGDITIVINGPNDTCGVRILPPILGKAQLIRQQLLGMRSQSGYTENKLPLPHGTTYLRNYGKNDMTKTFHIPKTNYDIDIEVVSSQDHVKIGYTAKLEGKHEIYITSKGYNIVGSPYAVTATKNILNLLEKDSFSLEDGEEIDIVDVKSDRKVVVRIVDFVTEKMLLKDDGVLEKISEDEAKYLMDKDTKVETPLSPTAQITIPAVHFEETSIKSTKFNEAANKIVKINKVCKLLNEFIREKDAVYIKEDNLQPKNQQDIPDVVNSTLGETTVNAFLLSNKRDKVIVPENISVSILTEKVSNADDNFLNDDGDSSSVDKHDINLADLKILRDVPFDGEIESRDTDTSSNPFLNEAIVQDDIIGKFLGTFVTSEFETNKNQNEETHDAPIKIIFEHSNDAPLTDETNPFIKGDIVITDRPKSPIFKDIANDSDYFDLHSDHYENTSENEFVNPFFAHQHLPTGNDKENLPVADFIIGAPVSLPPEIKSLSQETNIDTLDGSDKVTIKRDAETCDDVNHSSEAFCSSFERNFNTTKGEYLNINSNANDTIDNGNLSPKKEMRDSAYVSIDENNTLPDSNNNDNTVSKGTETKQKLINDYFLSNMGPAEREIWENCTELQQSEANKLHDEIMKANRRDLKKSNFTPIVEENDKLISVSMKGLKSVNEKPTETDPVTLAFAEINLLYNDYFPNSENNSTINEDHKNIDREVDQMSEYQYVKSASEFESDVMRHNIQSEGEISEIQENVTESVSVSQTLHGDEPINRTSPNNDSVKFGDITYSNIVLEKKKYWDERIRQIEANEEETRKLQRKRRPSAKQLRHNDSLSKRKGKQIIKKYLSTNDKQTKETENQTLVNLDNQSQNTEDHKEGNTRRVKNWKAFWDSKLDDESKEIIHIDSRVNSPLPNEGLNPLVTENHRDTKVDIKTQANSSISSSPVKQEIPEEVFKAFETSPKRFFGTSRRQILSKIDSSLGKPNAVKEPSIDNNEATCESGLVSSRISLFHNISQTEELSWTQRKSQSMHNIYQRKDSDSTLKSICKIESEEKINISETTKEDIEQRKESVKNITLKEKRARVTDIFYTKSFDESSYHKSIEDDFSDHDSHVKKTVKTMDNSLPCSSNNNSNSTHQMSSSKSEMDIFNKLSNKSIDEDFDKYKSYDELPKVSVKNFISLYEDVTKTAEASSTTLRKSPGSSNKRSKSACLISETAAPIDRIITSTPIEKSFNEEASRVNSKESAINQVTEDSRSNSITYESTGRLVQNIDNKSTYISLPDIDLEIVEKSSDNSSEISPEREIENSSTDYKSRFKLAKQYFQSLEELREIKKPKKLNECELLLYNKSNESLTDNEQNKPNEKKKMKSHTMPSSEITKFWNQLQEENNESKDNKFMKISEKFHVEDFFTDVMEGRLSRQGSLRGIPHKKAVLEAFRSMENISDSNLSPYELAVSQFNDFNEDTRKKNAQTYLNEYPYLPTTDPSNFHSRLDVQASGLIPFKELKRVRRNSVPDLRLNPSFTVDL